MAWRWCTGWVHRRCTGGARTLVPLHASRVLCATAPLCTPLHPAACGLTASSSPQQTSHPTLLHPHLLLPSASPSGTPTHPALCTHPASDASPHSPPLRLLCGDFLCCIVGVVTQLGDQAEVWCVARQRRARGAFALSASHSLFALSLSHSVLCTHATANMHTHTGPDTCVCARASTHTHTHVREQRGTTQRAKHAQQRAMPP